MPDRSTVVNAAIGYGGCMLEVSQSLLKYDVYFTLRYKKYSVPFLMCP